MPINLNRVGRAKALIDASSESPQLRSSFHSLSADLFLAKQLLQSAIAKGPGVSEDRALEHARVRGHVAIIDERVSELVTVGHKLQWQLTQHADGHLPFEAWVHFASLDLKVLFMLLRSSMDQAAAIIGHLVPANRGCKRPFSSFHDLWTYAHREDGAACLGDEVTRLVNDCEWFPDIKTWRDSLEHDGSRVLVTNDGHRPVFMIVRGRTFTLSIPEVMRNTNVVDFWLFVGLYVAYLLCFLEDLALLVRKTLEPTSFNANPSMRHPGLIFLRQAMDDLAV